jgi:hypothetical protein
VRVAADQPTLKERGLQILSLARELQLAALAVEGPGDFMALSDAVEALIATAEEALDAIDNFTGAA